MDLELTFEERRIVGALVEKAFTTPDQYPLTLNSLVNACNQKSCRNPMTSFGEELVLDTLDELRRKSLCCVVQPIGSRTDKWRHEFRDTLEISGPECAVLTELLLRGPQTDGALRQNAKRMVPFESKEVLYQTLEGLMSRETPLVVRLSPEGQKRGVRYAHTLYSSNELERLRQEEAAVSASAVESASRSSSAASETSSARAREIEALKEKVGTLEERIEELSGLAERIERLERELGL